MTTQRLTKLAALAALLLGPDVGNTAPRQQPPRPEEASNHFACVGQADYEVCVALMTKVDACVAKHSSEAGRAECERVVIEDFLSTNEGWLPTEIGAENEDE